MGPVRAPLADAAQGLDTSESAAPDDDQRCTDLGCDLDDAAVGGSAFELDRRLPPAGLDDRGRLVHDPGPVSGSFPDMQRDQIRIVLGRDRPRQPGRLQRVRGRRRRRGGSDAETALPRPRARRGRSTRRDAPWRSRRCRRRFQRRGSRRGRRPRGDRAPGLPPPPATRRRRDPSSASASPPGTRSWPPQRLRPPPAEDPPQLPARESRRASPASGPRQRPPTVAPPLRPGRLLGVTQWCSAVDLPRDG